MRSPHRVAPNRLPAALLIWAGATAIGLILARLLWLNYWRVVNRTIAERLWVSMSSEVALWWTIAVWLLYSAGPRPPGTKPGPGEAVGLTSLIALAIAGLTTLPMTRVGRRDEAFQTYLHLVLSPSHYATAVAATWTALWLSRLWRPRPTVADRAGRVLGVCWISSYAILVFLNYPS